MAHMFGVRPWEYTRMRVGEVQACDRYMAQLNEKAQSG